MIPNILYDDRRAERYEPLLAELKRQGIHEYRIWKPVEAPTVVESINRSHKAIVGWAKEMGLPRVTIFEDDVYFPAADGWRYYLANMPETFDLYSGGTYIGDMNNPNRLCGFHCYTVNETFYDRLLAIPDKVHIDSYVDERVTGIYRVCRPMAALQRAGWSSNNRAMVDYNTVLNPNDIYTGATLPHV